MIEITRLTQSCSQMLYRRPYILHNLLDKHFQLFWIGNDLFAYLFEYLMDLQLVVACFSIHGSVLYV